MDEVPAEIIAMPFYASIDQLKGLPDELSIVDRGNVLRDDGRAMFPGCRRPE
jgi:hypothetical protein